MKAKSIKLRMLITMIALMKHSDEEHRLNTRKLNMFLNPYGLECDNRSIADTIRVMKEYGFNIQSKGAGFAYGAWLEDRPLDAENLNALIFAVSTNPYISKSESERILQLLSPFVTSFQEPLLKSWVDKLYEPDGNNNLCKKYTTIREAISANRGLRYNATFYQYDNEKKEIITENKWLRITPKSIYQHDGVLYMIGYNHDTRHVEAVDLSFINDVKFFYQNTEPTAYTNQILASIEPKKHIENTDKKSNHFFYKGPIELNCKKKYFRELHEMFGPPCEPVDRDSRGKYTYTVSNTKLDTEKLNYIANVIDNGISIIGPKVLVDKIHTYYEAISKVITSPRMKNARKKD